jgi:hypothetical protein
LDYLKVSGFAKNINITNDNPYSFVLNDNHEFVAGYSVRPRTQLLSKKPSIWQDGELGMVLEMREIDAILKVKSNMDSKYVFEFKEQLLR